jgi:hypothetical protein
LFFVSSVAASNQKQNLLQVLVGASPTLFTQTKRGVRAKAFSLAKNKSKTQQQQRAFWPNRDPTRLCKRDPPRLEEKKKPTAVKNKSDQKLRLPTLASPFRPAQPESAWMVSPCLGLGCCVPAPPLSLTYPVHKHTHTLSRKKAPTAPSSPSAIGTQKANAPPPQGSATCHTESLVCSPRGECHCTSAMSGELSRPTS